MASSRSSARDVAAPRIPSTSAPDGDAAEFDNRFKEETNALARRLTVYVSSNDRALLMSRVVNWARRRSESSLRTNERYWADRNQGRRHEVAWPLALRFSPHRLMLCSDGWRRYWPGPVLLGEKAGIGIVQAGGLGVVDDGRRRRRGEKMAQHCNIVSAAAAARNQTKVSNPGSRSLQRRTGS